MVRLPGDGTARGDQHQHAAPDGRGEAEAETRPTTSRGSPGASGTTDRPTERIRSHRSPRRNRHHRAEVMRRPTGSRPRTADLSAPYPSRRDIPRHQISLFPSKIAESRAEGMRDNPREKPTRGLNCADSAPSLATPRRPAFPRPIEAFRAAICDGSSRRLPPLRRSRDLPPWARLRRPYVCAKRRPLPGAEPCPPRLARFPRSPLMLTSGA